MVAISPVCTRSTEMSFSAMEIEAVRQLVKLWKYKNNNVNINVVRDMMMRKQEQEEEDQRKRVLATMIEEEEDEEEEEEECLKTKKRRFRSIDSIYRITKPLAVVSNYNAKKRKR